MQIRLVNKTTKKLQEVVLALTPAEAYYLKRIVGNISGGIDAKGDRKPIKAFIVDLFDRLKFVPEDPSYTISGTIADHHFFLRND